MKFEDLTSWDLDLIRSNGSQMMARTRVQDRYEAIATCVLSCIHAKGFNVNPAPANLIKLVAQAIPAKQAYNGIRTEQTLAQLIAEVFTYLKVMGHEIVKDESRESTWSTPKESWYANDVVRKKSWMI